MKELGLAADDLAGLRAQPLEAVLAAQERAVAQLLGVVRQLPFQPVVDGDVLPRPPLEAIAGGLSRDVSILIGTNLEEQKLYSPTDPKAQRSTTRACCAAAGARCPSPAPTAGRAASTPSGSIAPRAKDASTCRPASSGTRSRRIAGSGSRRRGWPSSTPRTSPRPAPTSSPGSRRRSAGCSGAATRSRSRSCSAAWTTAWCSASSAITRPCAGDLAAHAGRLARLRAHGRSRPRRSLGRLAALRRERAARPCCSARSAASSTRPSRRSGRSGTKGRDLAGLGRTRARAANPSRPPERRQTLSSARSVMP